jgi:hypothetical protein
MINDKPYGALITGGLGYNPSIYLTSFFSLITVEVGPVPPVQPPSGGGTVPFGGLQPYFADDRRLVTITIKMGQKTWIEKYIVTADRAKVIVKTIEIINKYKSKAQVSIAKITNKTKNAAKVSVSSVKNAFAKVSTKLKGKDSD